jgi:hypothetical protein
MAAAIPTDRSCFFMSLVTEMKNKITIATVRRALFSNKSMNGAINVMTGRRIELTSKTFDMYVSKSGNGIFALDIKDARKNLKQTELFFEWVDTCVARQCFVDENNFLVTKLELVHNHFMDETKSTMAIIEDSDDESMPSVSFGVIGRSVATKVATGAPRWSAKTVGRNPVVDLVDDSSDIDMEDPHPVRGRSIKRVVPMRRQDSSDEDSSRSRSPVRRRTKQ